MAPSAATGDRTPCAPDQPTVRTLLGKGVCRERGSAASESRLPALSRKSGNPCTKLSGKKPARRIGLNQKTTDALSLAQIDGCPASQAFLSTAGAPSRSQREQIGLAARSLPNVRTVILAQDHDEAGERQAETLRERLKVPPHVTVRRRRPPENADWNDVVNADEKS